MEAGGIEPLGKNDVSTDVEDGCGSHPNTRAAPAMQSRDACWPSLAPYDADLQIVISRWSALPSAIRNAILMLANLQRHT